MVIIQKCVAILFFIIFWISFKKWHKETNSTSARQTRPVSGCTMGREDSPIGLWGGVRPTKHKTIRRPTVILTLFRHEIPQREQNRSRRSQQTGLSRKIAPPIVGEEKEGGGTQQQTSHLWPQERNEDQSFLWKWEDWLPQEGWGFHLSEGQGASWRKIEHTVWLIVSTHQFQFWKDSLTKELIL